MYQTVLLNIGLGATKETSCDVLSLQWAREMLAERAGNLDSGRRCRGTVDAKIVQSSLYKRREHTATYGAKHFRTLSSTGLLVLVEVNNHVFAFGRGPKLRFSARGAAFSDHQCAATEATAARDAHTIVKIWAIAAHWGNPEMLAAKEKQQASGGPGTASPAVRTTLLQSPLTFNS